MADLGKAYVQIVPSAQGIKAAVTKELGGVGNAGKSAGIAIAGKLKAAIAAAGIGALVVKGLKDALEEGGKLEQAYGGLETIYGDAADGAKKYAEAAASAGISANDYAEQAVSFGAALRQAYGGDTVAAVEAANTAIMDMADNSAKMGTDISAIQNAYQGFAKQNYTMLDNLKLGYGGTKTEMERLLADAEKFSGVKYDINNLGDVYDAIHVIQTELGLTGVAAEEAKSTLTGSANAMKAAWKNTLGALTTGEGLESAMTNLGESVGNFAANLFRMMGNVVTQLPALFKGLWTNLAPVFKEMGPKIMTALNNGIMTASGRIGEAMKGIASKVVGVVLSWGASIYEAGATMIQNLITAIGDWIGGVVEKAKELMTNFVNGIKSGFSAVIAAGRAIVDNIASGIRAKLSAAKAAATNVINNVKSAFNIGGWSSIGSNIINGIVSGLKDAASSLLNAAKQAAKDALQAMKDALKIKSPSRVFADEVGKMIPAGIAVGIEANLQPVYKAMDKVVDASLYDMDRATDQSNIRLDRTGEINRSLRDLASRPVVVDTSVTLAGDAGKLFKVVRKENSIRTNATNYNALAMAGV